MEFICNGVELGHLEVGMRDFWGRFSSVQSLSCVRLFATPWTAAHQASLSITTSQSLLKLMYIESVMPFNYLILHHPRFTTQIYKGFSNEIKNKRERGEGEIERDRMNVSLPKNQNLMTYSTVRSVAVGDA